MTHCFAGKRETVGWEEFYSMLGPDNPDGVDSTCLLEDGHDGPHEWTRDDEIRVDFSHIEEKRRRTGDELLGNLVERGYGNARAGGAEHGNQGASGKNGRSIKREVSWDIASHSRR